MVLVCGDPSEPVTAFVWSRFRALRIDCRILDLRVTPDPGFVAWSANDDRPSVSIKFADGRVDSAELTGVYFRNVTVDTPDEANSSETLELAYPHTDPQLAAALNSLQCRVVNRPAAIHSNRSKPYQALIIGQFFKVPETLVTNDPDAARSFYSECHEKVIFKSVSGLRSIVRLMNQDDLGRLTLVENCPTQFQAYIPGDNLRVHVIGEHLFPVRIRCDAVDYRYAGQEGYTATMVPAKLPQPVENSCIRLAQELGLAMAGIDLKETPEGQYYCLEVNTSPAFPFYESPTGPAVADALAEFLAQRTR
jgi:glutathione synthase/RimK-type ligase-like ATP-grasp enzyme